MSSEIPECFALSHEAYRSDSRGNRETIRVRCTVTGCIYCESGNVPAILRDENATECSGGYDPTFLENGSRYRPACGFYSSCGVQGRANLQSYRIQASRLVRPAQPSVPQVAAPAPAAAPAPYIAQTQQGRPVAVAAQAGQAMQAQQLLVPTHIILPHSVEMPEPDTYEDGTPVPFLKRLLVDVLKAAFGHGMSQGGKTVMSTRWLRKPKKEG